MKYYLFFDRWGSHTAIYDGTEAGVIKWAIDFMYNPVQIGKRTAFISHVAIWEQTEHDAMMEIEDWREATQKHKGVALVEYGVIDNVRIGMLHDTWHTGKHYLLKRDGTIAYEIGAAEYDRMYRAELRTRAKRVKEAVKILPLHYIPYCPVCGGIA